MSPSSGSTSGHVWWGRMPELFWERLNEGSEDVKPPTMKVLAREIIPYRHAIWCMVGDHPRPMVNEIVSKTWGSDGHVRIMLETFNFDSFTPDTLVEVVEVPWSDWARNTWEGREEAFRKAEKPRTGVG